MKKSVPAFVVLTYYSFMSAKLLINDKGNSLVYW